MVAALGAAATFCDAMRIGASDNRLILFSRERPFTDARQIVKRRKCNSEISSAI
jgi:hypothetical protein